jgi:protein-tyrosine phosphatase
MTPYTGDNLAGFARQQYIDVHCHCLPAVDDGPATMAEALALCRGLVNDSITTVIATPHQLGRFSDCNEAAQIRKAVAILNEELRNGNIALTVMAGGDVRVDERICQLLKADKILTLADGGKYILLELPPQTFIEIEPLLIELASLEIQAIISHPERHEVLARQPQVMSKWLSHPAHLQITCGSLLGDFGFMAQKAAWHLLSSGWATLVATDSHDLYGRKPRMKAAFQHISSNLGEAAARLVCIENPLRVLKGQDIASARTTGTRMCNDETVPSSL